jgi:hypothetical protein
MTRHFQHSSMNVKLPASLSISSERPFRPAALDINSFPQLATLISIQTQSLLYNRELQDAEGGQAQTYCKNRNTAQWSPFLYCFAPCHRPPLRLLPNLIVAKTLSVFVSFSHLLPYT